MANYLTNPKQDFVPTKLYTPNFEAISNVLATKQAQYNAGFNRFKNVQAFAQNLKLTNNYLNEDKNTFIKDAEQQLKNLASVDLSLGENVNKANSVFDPIINNPLMLADYNTTKKQERERLVFNSFRGDDEGLEYADQRNLSLMDIQQNKLKNATKEQLMQNPDLFNTVDFVPFTDLNKLVQKAVKDSDFAVESVVNNGRVVYKVKNGSNSIGNWTTYIDNLLSDRYNKQFEIAAKYQLESGILNTKRELASSLGTNDINQIPDELAKEYYFKNDLKNQNKQYSTIVESFNKKISDILTEINIIKGKADSGNVSQEDEMKLIELMNQKSVIEKQQLPKYQNLVLKTKEGTEEYNRELQDLLKYPTNKLAFYNRTVAINNLANGFASNESQTVQKSPEWEAMFEETKFKEQQIQNSIDNEFKQKQLDLEQERNDIARMKASDSSSSSSSGSSQSKSPVNNPLTYIGPDTKNTIQITPVEAFEQTQTVLKNTVINSLLNIQGGLAPLEPILRDSLPDNLKNKASEILITWADFVKNPLQSRLDNLSEDKKEYIKQVNKLLINSGVIKNGEKFSKDGGLSASYAIEQFLTKQFENNKDNPEYVSKYANVISSWNVSKKAREEYLANNQAKKDKENEFLTKLNENSELITFDEKGNKKVVDIKSIKILPDNLKVSDKLNISKQDLAKGLLLDNITLDTPKTKDPFKNLESFIKNTYGYVKGTKQFNDVLESYLDGTVPIRAFIGEETFNIKINGEKYPITEKDYLKLSNFLNVYGTDKNKKLYKNLQTVVPDKFVSKSDGLAGSIFSIDLSGTEKTNPNLEYNKLLLSESIVPGNINGIYENDGTSNKMLTNSDTDEKKVNLIKNLLGSFEDVSKYTTNHRLVVSPDGSNMTLTFTLNSSVPKNLLDNAGLKGTEVTNKEFSILINPNTTSPKLKDIIEKKQSSNIQIWNDLTKGKSIYSSPFEEAIGYRYAIVPIPNENRVKINITRRIYDKFDLNKPADWENTPREFYVSLNNATTNEIRNIIDEDKQKYLSEYNLASQQLKAARQATTSDETKARIQRIKNLKIN